MRITKSLVAAGAVLLLLASTGCSKPCDANTAQNKLLALGKVQGRVLAKGGEGLDAFGVALGEDMLPVHELIRDQKYGEACEKLDAIAMKYKIDLAEEQKDMITIEQLAADGGKGSGRCSLADAAVAQMALHKALQAEVDAGRKTSDIFRVFQEDTKGVAEMMSTNPSKACDLFDTLKKKYEVP